MRLKNVLPPAVAKKYAYHNAVGVINTPWGERVDLRTITVKKADELYKRKLGCLELIKGKSPKKPDFS